MAGTSSDACLSKASFSRRLIAFVGVILVMGVIWLRLLPGLLDLPAVRRHVELNKTRGIDPSALYYTELDERFFLDGR